MVRAVELTLMIEGQNGVTWDEWVALARACEEYGVPALFRSDHYLDLSGQHPERGSLDAWATICGLAAVTTDLRLGTMVSPATFRHPSELAKVATTADHISGGRIELGLGAGWHEREHAAYGFPFPDTRTRFDILEGQLQVVLGHWSGESLSFSDGHYDLDGLDAQPKPIQRPHPPLIMGGDAGPRSARLAAAYADEYNTAFPGPADVRERRSRIAEACERAGREMIGFSVMTTVIVGDGQDDLRDRLRTVADQLDMDADQLLNGPPDSWIVGDIDSAAEQLHELAQAGVDRVMCQHLAHRDTEFVALLGDRLVPLLAG
jgi:F420-dependent oxidoreductase-like protein